MAEDQSQPQSIADRIAALKLSQTGQVPSQPPPSYEQAVRGRPKPPPPPRPVVPARPGFNGRTVSSNNPPTHDHAAVSGNNTGNLPEAGQPNPNSYGMDGISRPALPPRTSTKSIPSPALPPRKTSDTPALPPRRPSEAPSADSRRPSDYSLSRRTSNESMSSVATARSGVSAVSNGTSVTSQSDRFSIKAPAYDPSALPPLPPKRTQEEKAADHKKYNKAVAGSRFPLKSVKSSPNVQPKQVGTTPPPPARSTVISPPSLPSRSETSQNEPARIEPPTRQRTEPPARSTVIPPPSLPSRSETSQNEPARIEPPTRQRTEPPPPRKSALSYGLNNASNTAPPVPTGRPGSVPQADSAAPPPVPAASKPDLTALQASKPKLNGAATPQNASPASLCLHCRDFSGPDNHAARFPRESLPSQDIGWLAQQLTAPFPSHTDKARALFTWLHHNVAYDTVAFFNNNVKPSTPQSTLQSGLAVCEGYAGLFAALAMKVGLEAYVVGGHGKGFGYSALQPGEPVPPFSAGHAWNVVKIDGGQWKLIDCCWGAGAVNGKGQPYKKRFAPERFTQSNDEFGLDHFPQDSSKQFRNDGRVVTWEEYILGNKNGCGAQFFSGFVAEEGLSAPSFQPTSGQIHLNQLPGPTVRFAFQKVCPHWDPLRNGKGPYYLYVLAFDNLEGTGKNHVPFDTNGEVWWCDVPVSHLGRPGMKVHLNAMTKFDGQDGRGLTIQRYRERMGRCGWAGGGVCKWEVA